MDYGQMKYPEKKVRHNQNSLLYGWTMTTPGGEMGGGQNETQHI